MISATMTLGTHAVVGAAVATAFPTHPVVAFAAGFVSHFILDSIPHWDYHLRSIRSTPGDPLHDDMEVMSTDFIVDISKILFDLFLGLAIALYAFSVIGHVSVIIVLLGAIGAVTPDTFHFIYFKTKWRGLTGIQRFHIGIQDKIKVTNPLLGITLQAIVVAIAIAIVGLV